MFGRIIPSALFLCGIFAAILVLGAQKKAHAQDITTGLIGHWKLDETTGTTAADSSGNGNDGTAENGLNLASQTVTGRVGDGLNFGNGFVAIPDFLGNPTELTVSIWAKADNWAGGNGFNTIFRHGPNAGQGPGPFVVNYSAASNSINFGTVTSSSVSANYVVDPMPLDQWMHIAGVYDGTHVILYINGIEVDRQPQTGAIETSDNIVTIGRKWQNGIFPAGNQGLAFEGDLDDARIYTRALSAEDVKYLYESYDGNVLYNTDSRTPKYFDGENWQAMGEVKYIPNAVEFDGVNDWLRRTSPLNSVSDTKMVTGSFWFRTDDLDNEDLFSFSSGTTETFRVSWLSTSDKIRFIAEQADPTRELQISSAAIANPTQWKHVLFSFDLGNTSNRHIYVNDVAGITDILAYVDADILISAANELRIAGNSTYLNGNMADVWIEFGTYIDLSVEANRRKFIDENGNPVFLGADGSLPTGSAPDIFLSGDTADWHTNKGTGGGFTENGTLTSAGSPASHYTLATIGNTANIAPYADGSAARLQDDVMAMADEVSDTISTYVWDGTDWTQVGNPLSIVTNNPHITARDGTTVFYYRATGDALMTLKWDGTNWTSQGEQNVGVFDDIEYIGNNIVALSSNTQLRAWQWDGDFGWTNLGAGIAYSSSGSPKITSPAENIIIAASDQDFMEAFEWNGSSWSKLGSTYVPDVDWQNVDITALRPDLIALCDFGDIQLYEWDGTDFFPVSNILSPFNSDCEIEKSAPDTFIYLNEGGNLMGTVRFAYCSNPARAEGSIIYNADSQVMQYCDGQNWRAMGPVPGDGSGGCSNPTRAEGSMVFNKDFGVMQYCEGDEWVSIGKEPPAAADPCAGSPSPGTTCADGSIYAGLSPDGNVPMYTTPADAPSLFDWNNGNFSPLSFVDTTMLDCVSNTPGAQSSCQTGESNTAILIAEDSDSSVGGVQPHLAAAYCDSLSAHGHTDWYLPAQDELNVLYTNKSLGSLNGTFNETGLFPAGWYWSSSELSSNFARVQRFSDGNQASNGKDQEIAVRCVRK